MKKKKRILHIDRYITYLLRSCFFKGWLLHLSQPDSFSVAQIKAKTTNKGLSPHYHILQLTFYNRFPK